MILLLVLASITGYIVYNYLNKVNKYWTNKGVASTKPWPIVGDMAPLIFKNTSIFENTINTYNMFPNERYFGIWQFKTPILAIRDLDVIKQIGIKDFDHFENHQSLSVENDTFFSKNLVALKSQEWHEMRSTLSPVFTSAKMKAMFVLMRENAEEFVRHYLKQGKNVITLDMKDTFTRYANDVIASTAFGIKCDSLAEPKNEFYSMGKIVTTFTALINLKFALVMLAPKLMNFFKITMFPKKVYEFFSRIIRETMEIREKENIFRPDMINLLMQAKKGKLKHETRPEDDEGAGFATVQESSIGYVQTETNKELSHEVITAQAMIFFFAGFETISTALCFMCHEVAVNADIQKKLQQEIDETVKFCNGKLTYEALMKMKYLDMVFSETLRRWHPAIQTDRVCTKPYTIQPKSPEEKPVHIEVGDVIVIPMAGIHMDPKYYPNPEKFDPERFSDENKNSIVPGSYLPFGIGPRNCIGSRFAIMEAKVIFAHVLHKFNIAIVEKTQIPLKLSRGKFNLTAENGFWLGLKAR